MNTPLVSIIIPVYNAGNLLEQTIQSAIGQTWQHKEIIIVDDGSTDNSLAIAKKYEHDGIKIYSQTNSGAAVARNYGIKESNGDYIQFLDADDLLSPDKIEMQMRALDNSVTHLAMCKTNHFFDGDDHNVILSRTDDWYYKDHDDPIDFLIKLYAGEEVLPGFGGMIQPNAWLTPRKLIEKGGLWNEFRSPDDDGEFFCRMVLASEGIKFVDEGWNYYRKFKDNRSLSGRKSLEAYQLIIASVDLKYAHLKARSADEIIDRVFAKPYWWTGVAAYPRYKEFSKQCIEKGKRLGYSGEKYVGGPAGQKIARFFGWKIARIFSDYQEAAKRRLSR